MLAKIVVDPKHAAAFVKSTRTPPFLKGEEAEQVLAAEARRAAGGSTQAAATAVPRRGRGGTSFTRSTAASRDKEVQTQSGSQRASSGAKEIAEVWEWPELRADADSGKAAFRMTDELAYENFDFEKEVSYPIILRVPVVPTRDDNCCADAAWEDFPFLARFCICNIHAKSRGTENNHTRTAEEEIATHANASKGKSPIDRHLNPVLRQLGMRPVTRNPCAR